LLRVISANKATTNIRKLNVTSEAARIEEGRNGEICPVSKYSARGLAPASKPKRTKTTPRIEKPFNGQ